MCVDANQLSFPDNIEVWWYGGTLIYVVMIFVLWMNKIVKLAGKAHSDTAGGYSTHMLDGTFYYYEKF